MDKYQYLTTRRIFVFLDEWLCYLLVILMIIYKFPLYVLIPTIILGIIMISTGYRGYWKLLEKFDLRK